MLLPFAGKWAGLGDSCEGSEVLLAARARSAAWTIVATAALIGGAPITGCGHRGGGTRLETADEEDVPVPDVPSPAASGPRLGALADVTPILDRPSKRGAQIGYLHAGATVARSAEPLSTRGCDGGWFAVRPKGFVCASGAATTDLRHPTLAAMAMGPRLDASLPYTYARAVRDTTLFEPDPARDDAVRPIGALRAKSGLAVIGSWTALDPSGKETRLAMMTDGHFLPAGDLAAATPSQLEGVALGGGTKLPVAFVVKRGVHLWALRDEEPEKQTPLEYHARVNLTGRFRTINRVELWATAEGRWVRREDVTLIQERHELPAFATEEQRWIDISIVTGALVAYEGRKPVFATLASVGRDRLGAPESNAATTRGELTVIAKHLTAKGRDPGAFQEGVALYDIPWALELSSGQLVVGAYWHDRFGIEHGPGNIELSPSDAARLFRFAEPELPEGWHGATQKVGSGKPTIVNVRK